MTTFAELTGLDTLSDLRSITDPLLVNAFDLQIPNLPGGGDTTALRLRLLSTTNPVEYEIPAVALHTHRFYYMFAGALKPKQSIDVVFQESANGVIVNSLQNWTNQTVNVESGYNYAKSNYATTAFLYLIGVNQKYTAQITMRNFWLSKYSMPDLAQDREKNDIVDIKATFVFDYIDYPIVFSQTT